MARVGLPVERMDDEALLAGFATGESEVALAFVRRFQAHVYAVALAIVGDPTVAEDVAQHSFERAWKHGRHYDATRGTVRVWLATITRNLAVDSLRRRRADPVDPTDLIRLYGAAADEPDHIAMRNESRSQLQMALRRLPAEQARALVMAGVYRMTAQEVADAERIPLGTAKTRIRAAMRRLRLHLSAAEVTSD